MVTGEAYQHTEASIQAGISNAQVALPTSLNHGKIYQGKFADLPKIEGKAPVVIFLHGSAGIDPKYGYDHWQKWLAAHGIASFIFDSLQLENRLRYQSPADKEIYEKVHQLRSSEIGIALDALKKTSWAETNKLFLAGNAEGAIAVARYDGDAFLGKLIYSWSCEDNYYVKHHNTSLKPTPVLNIIADADKYFSQKNDFIGNTSATGNCAATFSTAENADVFQVVLIPNAPHNVLNLPAARSATLGFIEDILQPTQP
ncbi:alpha/beta hydrolase [Suttonella ornithocola]|nr:alpha/beta hydrolase [Suttonella ornithocola]